jgi:hypothetical protein
LLCATAAGAPARAADDQTSELSDVGARAFEQLGTCLSPEDSTLNVLYVLDASSSLAEDTDTEGLRFAILAQSLRQLGSLSQDRQINTAVASFDLEFNERQPWQPLDQTGAAALAEWANSKPPWWGAGRGTNWEAALEQGDALMREAPGFKGACNMLVWVTDGGINVDGNWQEITRNASAMRQICASDPATGKPLDRPAIVDSMRTSGIHLVGVLLQSQAYLDRLQRADGPRAGVEESRQGYMRPITEGSGPVDTTGFTEERGRQLEYQCGISLENKAASAGALLLGSSPIALAYQLGSLSGRLAGAQAVEVSDGPPYTFTVPVGVNFVDAQIAGEDWSVSAPDGTVIATPTDLDTPGVAVISEGGISSVRLTGAVVGEGVWTIDVVDPPAKPRVSLAVRLEDARNSGAWRVGEPATVEFTFTDSFTGQPADPTEYRVADLDLDARAGATSTPLKCTPAVDAVSVSCAFAPEQVGTATITGAITIDSTDPTSPVATQFPIDFGQDVLPAATFPRIAPDVVTLSPIDGKRGTATGTLTVVGPEEGTGEVCFPEATGLRIDSDVVNRESDYAFSSAAWGQCLTVGVGERLEVPISVTNPVPATGTVQASFDVSLRSEATDATYPQTVNLSFDTIRQGTPPWWLLLLLTAAGVGIPLALLYLQSVAASRLAMKGLRMASVPVTVTTRQHGASLERVRTGDAGDESALVTVDDWNHMSSSLQRPRRVAVAEGVMLAAVTPRWPLSPLRAQAEAPTGARVLTEAGSSDDGLTARMSLAPAGQWILVARDHDLPGADPEQATFPARLVAFLSGTADAHDMNRELASTIATSDSLLAWPGIIRRIQKATSSGPAIDDVGEAKVGEAFEDGGWNLDASAMPGAPAPGRADPDLLDDPPSSRPSGVRPPRSSEWHRPPVEPRPQRPTDDDPFADL